MRSSIAINTLRLAKRIGIFGSWGSGSYMCDVMLFARRIQYVVFVWRRISRFILRSMRGEVRFGMRAMLQLHLKLNMAIFPFFIVRIFDNFIQIKIGRNLIYQPLDNIFINEEIYYYQVYDRFYNINEDDIVVDVGAHVGVFTLRAARKARKGLVIAIEPHPFNYWLLENNAKANNLSNIEMLNLGLWSDNGEAKLYLGNSGSHSLDFYRKTERYLKVQIKALDTLIRELGIKRVDFIKIDTEGSELEILRGAEDTLRINDLFLAIAAYHTPTQVREISQYLWKIGFRVFVYMSSYIYAFKAKGEVQTLLRSQRLSTAYSTTA